MYRKRHAEDALRKLATMFGAVLVTGSRQVEKSTLLTEIAAVNTVVTLDDPLLKQSAKEQGGTFLRIIRLT
ncbi:MAG: hypothetical protein LBM60_05200 [Clostridium sp.]|jgi:predicted AAA+ superfamily ATPase|nr:hypothetical protein [Clostridium sp.]